MQQITDLWKSTGGKLVLLGSGLAGLILLCFVCVICGVIFGRNATETPAITEVTAQPTPIEESTLESTTTPLPTSTQEVTATPEPTLPPLPSDTPSPTHTPEPAATSEPTAIASTPLVSAGDSDINIRSGPGTGYDIVGTLAAGQSLEIVGRNRDSSWWQVSTANGPAWIAASVVEASDLNDDIPVVEGPPAPTEVPLPTAISPPISPLPTTTLAPSIAQPDCDCSSNSLNCPNFGSQAAAQACYEHCLAVGQGDIHDLDRNNDGVACENSF